MTASEFRFDRTLNVQNLLTAAGIATALFLWASRMESRLATLEASQQSQSGVNQRQDTERERLSSDIREDLKAIREQLNRLAERAR